MPDDILSDSGSDGAPVVTAKMIEAAMVPWCAGDPEFEPPEDIVARILSAGLAKCDGYCPPDDKKTPEDKANVG